MHFPSLWTYHDPVFADRPDPRASWAGHRRFAYDLVRNTRPRRMVELGVCLGTSFFAFCQAIRDGATGTELVGVDTWAGDEHVGFYGPEYRERFEAVRSAHFADLPARPLVMDFDRARAEFPDGSIDVLHVDGCHTYEAARHDYETWRDAVAPDGIVLFHDIAVREGTFGVWRLWDELRREHETAEFAHSYGLGVLFPTRDAAPPRSLREEWRHEYADASPGAVETIGQ